MTSKRDEKVRRTLDELKCPHLMASRGITGPDGREWCADCGEYIK